MHRKRTQSENLAVNVVELLAISSVPHFTVLPTLFASYLLTLESCINFINLFVGLLVGFMILIRVFL